MRDPRHGGGGGGGRGGGENSMIVLNLTEWVIGWQSAASSSIPGSVSRQRGNNPVANGDDGYVTPLQSGRPETGPTVLNDRHRPFKSHRAPIQRRITWPGWNKLKGVENLLCGGFAGQSDVQVNETGQESGKNGERVLLLLLLRLPLADECGDGAAHPHAD